jgi:hypothetical protein
MFDHLLDMKFSFHQADIDFKRLKKGCWFNQNPGEGALTIKTELTKSLARKHQTISSIWPMVTADPRGVGVDSFYPRCFQLKSGESCNDFLHDYYFT